MPIVITDQETERLARQLAAATGQTLDAAIAEALRAQVRATRRAAGDVDISDIQAYMKSLPVVDPRPADEILYDEFGLPK